METNIEHLTDDELISESVSILDELKKETMTQGILMVFLFVYNMISFFYNSVNVVWYMTQIIGWGMYFYHNNRYNRKRNVFKVYRDEMIKREIL